jgi:hypothetical protein
LNFSKLQEKTMDSLNKNWFAITLIAVIFGIFGFLIGNQGGVEHSCPMMSGVEHSCPMMSGVEHSCPMMDENHKMMSEHHKMMEDKED